MKNLIEYLKSVTERNILEYTSENNKFYIFKKDMLSIHLELYKDKKYQQGFFAVWADKIMVINGYGTIEDILHDINKYFNSLTVKV